jgi:hypothetical protein
MRKRLPEIDLEELKKLKEQNFKERLEFLDWYAEWVKKSNNAKWSSAQKGLINAGRQKTKTREKILGDRERYVREQRKKELENKRAKKLEKAV